MRFVALNAERHTMLVAKDFVTTGEETQAITTTTFPIWKDTRFNMPGTKKIEKRLAARIKSYNERGTTKIAGGMRKPGSQNRKK
jgi:hypothetical protein